MKISGSILTAIGVALAGIIVASAVQFSKSQISQNYEDNLPYLKVCDNLKYKTTIAHLWFEEYMAGDESIDPENDVITKFTSAVEILEGVLEGRETELGKFEKPNDVELKFSIRKVKDQILNLEDITRLRWALKLKSLKSDSITNSSAGSTIDQQFDKTFNEIQVSLDDLKSLINSQLENDVARSGTLSIIVTVGIILIFIVMTFMLYNLQSKNEKEALVQSTKLNDEEVKVGKMTVFADHIGQGNYDASLDIDNIDGDSLATALSNMRNKLKRIADEDTRRNYINLGLANMSDILRTVYESSDQLYFNVSSYIVTYLNANQGGLFLINDIDQNDKHIEMVACVAFDRRKFLEKRIEFGEGLVGRCLLESSTIYMKEIPEGYISISSGLGESNPKYLLLVSLKLNQTIFGALEIASFNEIEPFQIELVEKLAETLASSISTVKINERTKMLLEKSQIQAEEMRAQEEEMRQNMEEIAATQEEMHRKEQEYIKIIADLKGEEQD